MNKEENVSPTELPRRRWPVDIRSHDSRNCNPILSYPILYIKTHRPRLTEIKTLSDWLLNTNLIPYWSMGSFISRACEALG